MKGAVSMEITYTRKGDYLIPDLTLGEPETRPIGKYGMLRRTFLKNYRKGTYAGLLLSGKLDSHLAEIDRTAREQVEAATARMAREQNVTEALKASDPMKWTGLMNIIRLQAEEAALEELIYN
jgi:maltooligosyltrehalose synthase